MKYVFKQNGETVEYTSEKFFGFIDDLTDCIIGTFNSILKIKEKSIVRYCVSNFAGYFINENSEINIKDIFGSIGTKPLSVEKTKYIPNSTSFKYNYEDILFSYYTYAIHDCLNESIALNTENVEFEGDILETFKDSLFEKFKDNKEYINFTTRVFKKDLWNMKLSKMLFYFNADCLELDEDCFGLSYKEYLDKYES